MKYKTQEKLDNLLELGAYGFIGLAGIALVAGVVTGIGYSGMEGYKAIRKEIQHTAIVKEQIRHLESLGRLGYYGGGHYMPSPRNTHGPSKNMSIREK